MNNRLPEKPKEIHPRSRSAAIWTIKVLQYSKHEIVAA
jgi:hypothetical protein